MRVEAMSDDAEREAAEALIERREDLTLTLTLTLTLI